MSKFYSEYYLTCELPENFIFHDSNQPKLEPSILVTWSSYRVEEDDLTISTGKILQCRDSLRITALIHVFQR